jgi:hypothetical protein
MRTNFLLPFVLSVIVTMASASPVDMMIGTRGYAMGGAFVAIADDPSAAYWNPAGLSQVENMSLMETNWILQDITGLNINYLSFAMPVKFVGTVSGSWLLEYARLEEGREASKSSSGEHMFSLSIGRKLWEKLGLLECTSLGFSINRYTFVTSAGNGAGLGFDIGLLTGFPYGFRLGVTGRSLGADVMGEKIDPELRFGIGYSGIIKNLHRVTVDIDGTYKMNRDYLSETELEPAKNNLKGHLGIEYAIIFDDLEIAVQAGGNGLHYSTLDSYGFSAGIGVKYLGYCVQYAFRGDSDPDVTLGYGHRLSLILELTRLTGTAEGAK